jgi:hypothetical protein
MAEAAKLEIRATTSEAVKEINHLRTALHNAAVEAERLAAALEKVKTAREETA